MQRKAKGLSEDSRWGTSVWHRDVHRWRVQLGDRAALCGLHTLLKCKAIAPLALGKVSAQLLDMRLLLDGCGLEA